MIKQDLDKISFIRVDKVDYVHILMQYEMGHIRLYTKKNHAEFVELRGVADVNKYCNRLYICTEAISIINKARC